ncbi:MAG: CopD family protein [Acidibrevibacterium sp.]|uniref:CopD family protein n=1 Tax=Acidibrevibacterium sp. TaxID=2606776 RepID=UPI003D051B01
MTPAEAAVALAQVVQICGMVSAFGSFVFRLTILPGAALDGAARDGMAARLAGLARASLVLALLAAAARLVLQAAVIAGAASVGDALAVIPDIVRFSRFGTMLVGEGGLMALALFAGRGARGGMLGAALLVLAFVLAAGSLHGAAVPGWRGGALWAVASLHMLATALWLGGIWPLAVLLGRLSPAAAAPPVARFSALAMSAVAVLALTALAQASVLVGSMAGLTAGPYGQLVVVKSLLFLLLLGLAARNRLLLLPALRGGHGEQALRLLRHSLRWSLGLAFLVLLAAGFLASLAPGSARTLSAGGGESGEEAAARDILAGAPLGMPLHADRKA